MRVLIILLLVLTNVLSAQSLDDRIYHHSCPSNDAKYSIAERIKCFKAYESYLISYLKDLEAIAIRKFQNDSLKKAFIQKSLAWKQEIELNSKEVALNNPKYNFEEVRLAYVTENYRSKIMHLHGTIYPSRCGQH